MTQPQPWRDLTDPRRAETVDDLEAGLKAPDFDNLEIPEEFGPVEVVVDDHKIKRFAFTHDDYLADALDGSPFGGRIGHAALLGNDLVQLFTTVYAGSQVIGLHTEEQLWFDNPAHLDEIVTLSGTYTEAYERRGQGYVVMDARAVGADGRSIIRHRGVEILRTMPGEVAGRASTATGSGAANDTAGANGAAAASGTTGAPERRVTGEVAADAVYIDGRVTDPAPGVALTPLVVTITQEQASVFSRTGEYVRNIHNDLDIARTGGLRRPIVQGQQQIGLLAKLLTRAFGADFFTSGWMRVKFVAPVDVFDEVTVGAVITGYRPADAGHDASPDHHHEPTDSHDPERPGTVDLDIWVRRPDGRLSAAGWARVRIGSSHQHLQGREEQ